MKEIVIITAFFDIGRENFVDIPRSTEKYFEYFERWARIQNELYFVCENEKFAEKVLEIREKFGLKEKTHIIKINNIETLDPELIQKMKAIEKDETFINFRANKIATENIAMYDYVMLLKYYCTYLVAQELKNDANLAWIDFGYEHGGETFKSAEDYNFKWEYDFGDKIVLFNRTPLDARPIFEIVKTLEPVCIMGATLIIPKNLAKELWELCLISMKELVSCGFIDDDQTILLMAYRKNPEIFKLILSDWFLPIKEFGGNHMQLKELQNTKRSFFSRVKSKIKKILRRK